MLALSFSFRSSQNCRKLGCNFNEIADICPVKTDDLIQKCITREMRSIAIEGGDGMSRCCSHTHLASRQSQRQRAAAYQRHSASAASLLDIQAGSHSFDIPAQRFPRNPEKTDCEGRFGGSELLIIRGKCSPFLRAALFISQSFLSILFSLLETFG